MPNKLDLAISQICDSIFRISSDTPRPSCSLASIRPIRHWQALSCVVPNEPGLAISQICDSIFRISSGNSRLSCLWSVSLALIRPIRHWQASSCVSVEGALDFPDPPNPKLDFPNRR